mmetsp:Transcript_41186/g.82431  ORF Transcript_41186/g.82431 Transcript_41186/m.82431 type:complete len:326 (+) Transcript_41186:901-1878(+)
MAVMHTCTKKPHASCCQKRPGMKTSTDVMMSLQNSPSRKNHQVCTRKSSKRNPTKPSARCSSALSPFQLRFGTVIRDAFSSSVARENTHSRNLSRSMPLIRCWRRAFLFRISRSLRLRLSPSQSKRNSARSCSIERSSSVSCPEKRKWLCAIRRASCSKPSSSSLYDVVMLSRCSTVVTRTSSSSLHPNCSSTCRSLSCTAGSGMVPLSSRCTKLCVKSCDTRRLKLRIGTATSLSSSWGGRGSWLRWLVGTARGGDAAIGVDASVEDASGDKLSLSVQMMPKWCASFMVTAVEVSRRYSLTSSAKSARRYLAAAIAGTKKLEMT